VIPGAFRLCQVHLTRDDPGQPFARAHAERLPCHVSVLHGDWYRPRFLDDEPLRSTKPVPEAARRAQRVVARLRGRDPERDEITADYTRAFQRARCDAVLVEFGHIAVQALDACRALGLPLIVHFHGFDAHSQSILDRYGARYGEMFEQAAALVVVSRTMQDALLALGAPPDKTHHVPYGVDLDRFGGAAPERAPARFLAVGRFVEKKAPLLTLAAFASARRLYPDARLRMIGDGELLEACRERARELGIGDVVEFVAMQPNDAIAAEMRQAPAFVQHSIVAVDGNSEGMPVAILEAGASGLPVVSTRHAGIPEIVEDGKTGFLVAERDVEGMAERMERLLAEPRLAGELGRSARRRIEERFSIDSSTARLWEIISTAAGAA
jgi:colanic acid/amylovoran biosynthesis glycosyltransferase